MPKAVLPSPIERNFDYVNDDQNNLTDPYENTGIEIPFPPAEPSPIGTLDGIYPREDLEGKSVSNLYYGVLDEHQFSNDGSVNNSAFDERSLSTMPFEIVELTDNTPMEMVPDLSEPVILYSDKPTEEQVLEMHDNEEEHQHNHPAFEIIVDELPGVDHLDEELEKSLDISDDTVSSADALMAADESKKSKKDAKWDYKKHLSEGGCDAFLAWIKERVSSIPKHSGYDKAGLERAISYMEKLVDEIHKAMREDIDGVLDADKIEDALAEIEEGIERLHARVEKVKASKKSSKRSKKSEISNDLLIKHAQKAPTVSGIIITVPLLISKIARVIINGMVSGGHDANDIYQEQVKMYKLSMREQAELQELLFDMNMPLRMDRGYLPNEEIDMTDGKFDWASGYQS
jgi:hypothetical protein